ncbi:MAG: deoxyguanosinetriphosphate triphosphohydrolase [Lachnospiraceae bacterium]|nr:deoxyguanosinetriphosphate triphosphohydrolase [Lachnospiraceae bacterium]
MNIREEIEKREHEYLSPRAAFADESLGRDRPEDECPMRTVFQRDRDRIIHSKSFRRLKHKTQVFLAPAGDHYRTRLTHTLEVAQISRTIARALRLNEDLTEAIALGHDLGHTPFGHAGEAVLNELCADIGGFRHNEQSVRTVEVIEKGGEGLNLTKEVRDGMLNHRSSCMPATLEGQIVRIADKIAYINHDIDDAIRAGVLAEEMFPSEYTDVLGHSVKIRLDRMITCLIEDSADADVITMRQEMLDAMKGLRTYLFRHLYRGSVAKAEDVKAQDLLRALYAHYLEHFDGISEEYRHLIDLGDSKERVVCDYIAGMSDSYAIQKYQEIFVPKGWAL